MCSESMGENGERGLTEQFLLSLLLKHGIVSPLNPMRVPRIKQIHRFCLSFIRVWFLWLRILIDHHYEHTVNTTQFVDMWCQFEFVSMFHSQFQVIIFGKHEKLMKRKRNITYIVWIKKSQRKEIGDQVGYSFLLQKQKTPLNLYRQF